MIDDNQTSLAVEEVLGALRDVKCFSDDLLALFGVLLLSTIQHLGVVLILEADLVGVFVCGQAKIDESCLGSLLGVIR